MNEVDLFQKVLKLRTLFKNVNQVSWNITQAERRFPFEGANNEELEGLEGMYLENLDWLEKIIQDYKDLYENHD